MSRFGSGILFFIALALYFSRWALLLPVDLVHLQDRFDHSQWRIPQSSRVISDNELYQVAGIRLVQGADPFSINPEVPPLAKYLYGWSWAVTGNPHWLSVGLLVVAVWIFYQLTRKMTTQSQAQQFTTWIFLISPLLLSQLTQTMLDLPQLVALLIHWWAVNRLITKPSPSTPDRSHFWTLVAGLSLGAAAATKFPLVIPIILLADGWLLWKLHKLSRLVQILFLTGLVYVSSYAYYFWLGHTPIEWLKAQKWMLHFYLGSRSDTAPLTFWITSFTGSYQGWWNEAASRVGEWTWWWPASLLLPAAVFIKDRRKLSPFQSYLFLCWMGLLGLYTLIPFWPRYFLSILPLGILLAVPILEKMSSKLKYLIISGLLLQTIWFWRQPPTEFLKFTSLDWQAGNYQDVATYIDPAFIKSMSRQRFAQQLKQVEQIQGGKARRVAFSSSTIWPWQDTAVVQMEVTYPLTKVTQPLLLRRLHNRWFIMWDQSAATEN